MQWIELTVTAGPDTVEAVASILEQYGHGGAVIEETQSEITGENSFQVKAYLPNNHSRDILISEIEQNLSRVQPPFLLQQKLLKPQDWFDSLKLHFGVLEIGDKFIIKPGWISRPLPDSSRTLINLDPGAAFGTGLHPTTRLCLLQLEKHLKPGMSVFDLGTGSGILSIAAVKLGAASVLALDIDPVAVRAARRNIKINGVDDQIQVRLGTLSLRSQSKYKHHFDLVLANITARAISDFSTGFSRVLKPGGRLIVSGIHSQGLDEVLISLSMADFALNSIDHEDEWYVVVAEN